MAEVVSVILYSPSQINSEVGVLPFKCDSIVSI
jgi:hypothetical protein